MLSAVWIVHIPAITQRAGVSHTLLGIFILLMSVCAIAGMQAAGPLADRLGSRTLTATAATLLALTLPGMAFATTPATLAIAMCAFGFGNGMLDVSMNAQAVHVERAYTRPIMSAFHALFSLGGFVGALTGAATQRADWNVHTTFLLTAAIGLALVALCAPRLLGSTTAQVPSHLESDESTAATPQAVDPESPGALRNTRTEPTRGRAGVRKVLLLGGIAFVVLMAEGVAADWSALQLRDRLAVEAGTAGLAFAAFSATMTLGRFGTDRLAARVGRVAVLRYGTLLAAAGFAIVALSGWLPLSVAGWALCGIGLSGAVPQVFTAAGNLGSATAATDMSRVFGLGYLGLLAGPAIIGWLTQLVSLTTAMAVPLVALLLCARGARAVAATTPAR